MNQTPDVCSQAAAREMLRPSGFVLTETVKKVPEIENALLRHFKGRLAPTVPPATEMLTTLAKGVSAWVQIWSRGESRRVALIDPMTMCILRLYDMHPNYERIFPPRESTSDDLMRGANL